MLLNVKNLHVEFNTLDGCVKAVNGVTFGVNKGEVLGIVGESGSGKSVATHAVLQLVPSPPGRVTQGEIIFDSRNLLSMSEDEINKIRGKEIGMIFQEPMTSLNPVYTIGNQIIESYKLHLPQMSKSEYQELATLALKQVGIPSPETRLKCYPHELSGGMRQRVMIAISLACNPQLLIADEPTTALDVTIQAQILDILNDLKEKQNLALILITHDLAVIAETADRVAVMYAGKVVEYASAKDIFNNPRHPYTRGLLESIPAYQNAKGTFKRKQLLKTIKGMVPDLRYLGKGCAFYERCQYRSEKCMEKYPNQINISKDHTVACFNAKEI